MTNKERFKANIRLVEIEPHSYCNRKCWFCPNSFIDRTGPTKYFDRMIYSQILTDLVSIDYSESMSFNGWCEPFSKWATTRAMMQEAKKLLPNVSFFSNSNTDFLSTALIHDLANVGLSFLRCQLYFDKDEEYTESAIHCKMDRLKAKLPCIEFEEEIENQWFALVGDMIIMAYAKDFKKVGHNRCDVQIRSVQPFQKRHQICYEGVTVFGINHNGWVVPCCNIRSDYPPHKDVLLGKMDDSPGKIFELYKGVILPETQYPCSTCIGKQSHLKPKSVYEETLRDLKNGKSNRSTVSHNHQVAVCKAE